MKDKICYLKIDKDSRKYYQTQFLRVWLLFEFMFLGLYVSKNTQALISRRD